MREIFYAIYKSATIDVVLNTLLAEAVLRNKVECTEKNVKPIPGKELSEIERTVLDRMIFGEKANVKTKHIIQLRNFYLSACIEEGYIKRRFLLGFKKTPKFRKEIRVNVAETFNKHIVDYIDTKDANHLKTIVKSIDLIKYPSFCSQRSSRIGLYKDRLAMQNAAVDHRFGIQHPPPGR